MTMREPIVKALSILLCIIIVSALTLFAMGRLSAMIFWILAGFAALVAFVALPRLKKT